jgi:hypothetical protein
VQVVDAYDQAIRNGLIWSIAPPAEDSAAVDDGGGLDLPTVRDGDDLDKFLRDRLNVRLPKVKCCAGHSTPHAAFHDAFFATSPISVWKASRGMGGKSFTLATLAFTEAVLLRADVNILGGSGEQSKRIVETIGNLWELPTAPRAALLSEPGAQKQKLIWHNRIVALMASQTSVRGPHPQRLRLDEVDEMKLAILDSALGQPMSKGWIQFQVVMSSTHQYADGTMAEVLKRAAAKGHPIFEWCYRENLEPHGWLSLAEVERKRAVLTTAMWDTEIELQEPSSEGRAIEVEKTEQAFQLDVPLEAPVAGAQYSTGADWAKKKNHTVVVTIRKDVRPMRVAAIKVVNKEPWPKMAGYLDTRIADYPGTSCHDNTGIGQVVHDLLNHDSEPFNMVGRQRADLLSEYVAAIEKGDLVWPKVDSHATGEDARALQQAYSEHKYATRDDLYKGSKDGSTRHHLPDTISAAALAWRAASQALASSAVKAPEAGTTTHLERLSATLAKRRGDGQQTHGVMRDNQDEPLKPVGQRKKWRRPGGDDGPPTE